MQLVWLDQQSAGTGLLQSEMRQWQVVVSGQGKPMRAAVAHFIQDVMNKQAGEK